MFAGGKQVRAIVAAPSKKRAAELVGTTVGELNSYWSITGNATELQIALAAPEQVFQTSSTGSQDFQPCLARN